ncbi:MAG: hypothetical protein ACYC2G_09565 [Gemmatimonadaceae bacterium]
MSDDTRRDPRTPEVTGEREAEDRPLPHDDDRPSLDPAVTGPLGAAAGAVAGATAGTLTAGPIGTMIGAIVGAVGGGWAGVATSGSAQPSTDDEIFYQQSYRGATGLPPDARYERVRPAFHLGHAAAWNPDYRGRPFEEIEPDLRRGWTAEVGESHGAWAEVRDHARAAYHRASGRAGEPAGRTDQGTVPPDADLHGTASHRRAEFNDPLPEPAEQGPADRAPVDRPGQPRGRSSRPDMPDADVR